jgi:tRNA(Ile2) C34 agmatinyltransferase TiaS
LIKLRNTAGDNEQDIHGRHIVFRIDQKGIVDHLASEESMYDTPAATQIQSSIDDIGLRSVTVTAAKEEPNAITT